MSEHKIEKLQDVINGYIDGSVVKQVVTRLTAPGDNYGSLMLKVDITVKKGDKEEVVHTVAKCVPPNESIRQVFNTKITFHNEIAWYTTIIPTMQNFQRERGVKNVLNCFCKFYGARESLDPNKEIDEHGLILFENIVELGFINEDRYVGFDLPTSKAIIKNLAEFHAIPIGIKLTKPDIFESNIKKYLFGFSEHTADDILRVFDVPGEIIMTDPQNAHLIPRIKKALKHFPFGHEGVREPWASSLHSDFWMNNIMVKPGVNPEAIMVDLQTTRYASITCDLIFFLMTSVEMSVAQKHIDSLIDYYHEEFIKNLTELKIDTTLFSYEKFMKELNTEAFGQFTHVLFFVVVMMYKKGSTDYDTLTENYDHWSHLKRMSELVTEKHRRKYQFVVEEFSKRNWI